MVERSRKTERLIRLWVLLHNNPQGYSIRELAVRFGVNVRTVYRDLAALQHDLRIPVYNEDRRWKLNHKEMLPPLRLTLPEALNIFLAARLMASYDRHYDPNMDATFSKLATMLPQPLSEQVQRTVDWMRRMPRDERYLRTLDSLARAWVEARRVKIRYRAYAAQEPTERIIEPYFIQPAATGHASYVIAYCQRSGEIRNFRIGRIEAIQLTGETYTIPEDFDANEYLAPAWDISVEGEPETVRLKFAPEVKRLVMETIWHPSQRLEAEKDGSVVMTLEVTPGVEFQRWVLSWGSEVEVLAPQKLRKEVMRMAGAMAEIYQK